MTDSHLQSLQAGITDDPRARFAISLDRLAYAQDNHRLGSDLVRTYVRNVDPETLSPACKPGTSPHSGTGCWH